ncbi:MAG: Yip1 family protein [Trueperaceae bacterium]|nr:Yip1 family protein [Trueperaceae bacterium]
MPNENDARTYSVELTAAPESREDRIAAAKQLAKEVGADAKKVFQLISSAPKTISRSMSRDDAESMAELCRDAGLEVSVVAAEPETERWAPATKVVQQARQGGAPQGRTQTRTQAEPPAGELSSAPSASRPTERPTGTPTETEHKPSVSIGGMRSSSPYVTILFAPRRTMRYVLEAASDRSAIITIVVLSLTATLPFVVLAPFLQIPLLGGVGVALLVTVFAVIGGLVGLYLNGFFYYFFGQRLFGGQANYRDARMAYAWGFIPGVWMTLAILVVALLIVVASVTGSSALIQLLLVTSGILGVVAAVWSLVVQAQALGEAHRFSAWRGLGTIIASALIPSLLVTLLQTVVGVVL